MLRMFCVGANKLSEPYGDPFTLLLGIAEALHTVARD